jgi:hypothetical protein
MADPFHMPYMKKVPAGGRGFFHVAAVVTADEYTTLNYKAK